MSKQTRDIPKFRYLWAWDSMMRSTTGWKMMKQEEAERDGAPWDATFKGDDGVWHRFADVTNEGTKHEIKRIMEDLGILPKTKTAAEVQAVLGHDTRMGNVVLPDGNYHWMGVWELWVEVEV